MSELATPSRMTPEKAAHLRQPFTEAQIGKLPKPVKGRDEDKGRCEPSTRYSADGYYCGGWHSRSVHLDFVGHAAATHRLLEVDPEWTWEPFALDAYGLPLVQGGNLWIRLTICGVTRPGVGDGSNLKEMIGDAIRNAAMRFGVALDLWTKENLHDATHDTAAAPVADSPTEKAPPPPSPLEQAQAAVWDAWRELTRGEGTMDALLAAYASDHDGDLRTQNYAVLNDYASELRARADQEAATAAATENAPTGTEDAA